MSALSFIAVLALLCGASAIPVKMCINCDDVVNRVFIGGVPMLPLGPNTAEWFNFDCYTIDLPEGDNIVAWEGFNRDPSETGCMAYFDRVDPTGESLLTAANQKNVLVAENIPDSAQWWLPSYDASGWNASTNCTAPLWDPHVPGAQRVWLGDCIGVTAQELRQFRFQVSIYGPEGPRVPCGHLTCSALAVANETLNPQFCMACGGNPSTGAGYCTLYSARPSICDEFPGFCYNTASGWCVNWGPNACLDGCKVTNEGTCYVGSTTCTCPSAAPVACGYKACSAAGVASSDSRFGSLCGGNPSTGAGYCKGYSTRPVDCNRFPDFCFQAAPDLWCVSATSACEDACVQPSSTNTCGACCA